ncbi:MAG: GH25 family lysozyme, partial [Brachybacterium sp.]
VAAYTENPPEGVEIPGTWNAWEIWQYSDSGPFAGDSNLFYGSEEQFEAFVSDKDYDPVSN